MLRLGGGDGYKELAHTILGPTGPRVTGRTLESQENGCESRVCHLRGCQDPVGEGTAFLFYSEVQLVGMIAQGRHKHIHTTALLSTPTFLYSDNLRKSTEKKRFLLCRGFSLWSLSPAVWGLW